MGAILGVILLDETVISVALPTIQKDLGLSRLDAHWVVNVYLLVLACCAGAAGRLGDILGVRWLLSAGLLIFGVASVLGGLSESGNFLIGVRAIQGIGAAFIFPLSLVVLIQSFEEHERGMALGLYGAIGTVFLSLGPLVGGALTEYLSWRWIFWINPPVVLLVGLITWICWRDPPDRPASRFDWIGVALLIPGLAALIFGIMEGPDRGWMQPEVLIALLAGLTCLILFVRAERHLQDPLIAISLFSKPGFTAANLIVFTAQFGKIVLFVFGALYFQSELGFSPVAAGIALLPVAVPQVILAPFAGKIADRHGTRMPALAGVTCGLVAIVLAAYGAQTGNGILISTACLIWGCSAPFLFVPPRRAIMSAVPQELHGQVSGISMTSQLMGGTIGVALGSSALALTGSFASVFWMVAICILCVLAYAYLTLERSSAVAEAD